MKKILGLTIAALLVVGLAGVGTWAYFGDTETSSGSLTAGTLDLQNGGVTTFSASDIMPGQTGSGSTIITNGGSVDGTYSVSAGNVTNTESGSGTEFHDTDNGTNGELGAEVKIALYLEIDGVAGFSAGDKGLKSDNTTYSFGTALDFQPINSYNNKAWNSLGTLAADGEAIFHVDWQFPNAAYDQSNCQGDSVSIDFTFSLQQITNP